MVGKRKETRRVKCSGESDKKCGRSRGEYQLSRRNINSAKRRRWQAYLIPMFSVPKGTVYKVSYIQGIYSIILIIE